MITLDVLVPGESGKILAVGGEGALRHRLLEEEHHVLAVQLGHRVLQHDASLLPLLQNEARVGEYVVDLLLRLTPLSHAYVLVDHVGELLDHLHHLLRQLLHRRVPLRLLQQQLGVRHVQVLRLIS